MASLTIPNLDDELARRLKAMAHRDGLSVEEEARRILYERALANFSSAVGKHAAAGAVSAESDTSQPRRSHEERERVYRHLLSLGREQSVPFDQKAFTDELWNFVE
ncbi:MAG TPA: hypothetical protein ENH55_12820 [Aurantimonas coralicida]|uniref:Antitoxin FitA-like ribbon-helix-helix domain-containing protein n=2 Tax=root TaxID=1 RepID=A0A9C9NIM3_9HYPH|nr:hypothetical protein [Aurantimonas coralicida]HEU02512.1 hypothetical protein [Aurantimonas coralicida]